MKMKKLLVMLLAMITVFAFTACGGGGSDEGGEEAAAPEPVTSESGAISVNPLDIEGYITEAETGREAILLAKEGEGSGSGEYVYIDGALKDAEDATWELRCPSYKFGEEYTFDMLKADMESEYPYDELQEVVIGDYTYLLREANSTSICYYTAQGNHPVLIQLVGESMLDNEDVMTCLESIQYNY